MTTYFPIREISSYSVRNWTIKARVTAKSPVRHFTNARGGGSVFSVDLLDKEGSEIRGSFFNAAAEKFDKLLQKGKVYTFSKGNVKVANKRYSSCNHNYEIVFEEDSQIVEVQDDVDDHIDKIKYSFCPVRELKSKSVPSTVDLLVVIKDHRPAGTVNSKNGAELFRRNLTVCDESGCCVDVTFWNDLVNVVDESVLQTQPVVAMKGVSVRDYGGRSCSTLNSTQIEVNPDIPEAKQLKIWWANTGCSMAFTNLSQQGTSVPGSGGQTMVTKEMTIAEMKNDVKNMDLGGSMHSYEIIGRLQFVTTRGRDGNDIPIFYMACESCNRKMAEGSDGFCQACNRQVNVKARYMLRSQFVDSTDDAYLTCFHDQAHTLIGRPVEDFVMAQDVGKSAGNELKEHYYDKEWKIRVRAKMETYQGEPRPRITVSSLEPMDPKEHCRRLLAAIHENIGKEDDELHKAKIRQSMVGETITMESAVASGA
ncbi:Replication protein A 70 kDa DNA-binding subunit, putative [Perkinsus marinus ATCC 50983]|uniref:Replication protein A subunit n=1 Tax=Perkinsus marinus (strain ATCC 50983 / TXsc) TaxID=423536 RepID=C5KBU1_PERM5|nr:Replication protein A 70 kDa DNA-binding subunit, putative [Perkinsus marinus ATCC 50983]EER17972.1 Replication protein A 70 kDa DNA-binding subunit, putative [Perkinsus marinus ATCC 50983]|eukprot:XP_002786176.1 Replication protein A 70 kDa DNA-binding subunit, putative [Perkinsus marinus ATCC 50983]